ncbi:hypothetical protein [Streptomyces sp. WAC04114]|uniref:hypothetical protein n=1 Tax=Streptomyces sp. WAC04114 TaxID=2867961 RepID=UPI001C8BCAE0|nr:hypothetical protein [Streptomyces sp. WAC04114]MBX9364995.1 hypothetical protein [Streptomyces sp. WAC04114]
MATTRDLPQHIGRWIAWPGYVWLALMMYVSITLLLAEPLRLLVACRGKSRRISGGARAESLPQSHAQPRFGSRNAPVSVSRPMIARS